MDIAETLSIVNQSVNQSINQSIFLTYVSYICFFRCIQCNISYLWTITQNIYSLPAMQRLNRYREHDSKTILINEVSIFVNWIRMYKPD
jgi:hypothetical protein